MDLATLQRSLSALIRGGACERVEADPYVRRVAGSNELALVRDVVRSWRALSIRGRCPLTCRVLDRLGRFDATLDRLADGRHWPPFVDEQGALFLDALARDDDDLASSVARFESALLRTRAGGADEIVAWRREPYAALDAILSGGPLPPRESRTYATRVSREIDGGFSVDASEPDGEGSKRAR